MRTSLWILGIILWAFSAVADDEEKEVPPAAPATPIAPRIHGEPGWPPYEPNLQPDLSAIGWLIQDYRGNIVFAEDFAHRLETPPCNEQVAKGGAAPAGPDTSPESGT